MSRSTYTENLVNRAVDSLVALNETDRAAFKQVSVVLSPNGDTAADIIESRAIKLEAEGAFPSEVIRLAMILTTENSRIHHENKYPLAAANEAFGLDNSRAALDLPDYSDDFSDEDCNY